MIQELRIHQTSLEYSEVIPTVIIKYECNPDCTKRCPMKAVDNTYKVKASPYPQFDKHGDKVIVSKVNYFDVLHFIRCFKCIVQ